MIRPALLLAAALALPGHVHAQPIDMSQGGAIDVTARDGMELRQNERMVIATGAARAVRGGVTVTADRLIARYRPKTAPPGTAPVATPVAAPVPPKPGTAPGAGDTGSNEIYRLEAEGNVHIFTATDLAVGDKAVYDIDQAVLLMTGKAMTITTPNQVMTARDTMEYWSQKHMSVGRGLATVVTTDGRRIQGDILVGYSDPAPHTANQPAPAAPAQPPTAGKPPSDSLGASGKLQRVEAFGNVELRTQTDIIKGDRGVYVQATGISRIAGNVKLTRGQNQLEGDEALVNMTTGISTLVRDPGKRVQGLVIPNDAQGNGSKPGTKPDPSKPAAIKPASTKPAKGTAPSTPAATR